MSTFVYHAQAFNAGNLLLRIARVKGRVARPFGVEGSPSTKGSTIWSPVTDPLCFTYLGCHQTNENMFIYIHKVQKQPLNLVVRVATRLLGFFVASVYMNMYMYVMYIYICIYWIILNYIDKYCRSLLLTLHPYMSLSRDAGLGSQGTRRVVLLPGLTARPPCKH